MVYLVENLDFFLKNGRKIEYKAENENLNIQKDWNGWNGCLQWKETCFAARGPGLESLVLSSKP